MATSTRPLSRISLKTPAPESIVTALAFLVLFWQPMSTMARDWWNDPDAGHGLLLFPVALFLAWRRGRSPDARPQPALGLALLLLSVLLRYVSGLAAELYTMRLAMLGATAGLIIFHWGFRQILHWWLPTALIVLSVPLPAVILGTLALPLQLVASEWGAALLEARHVPVRLAGNVLYLPGRSLFVTEACSGLRSLTALVALGVLIGGLLLRTPWTRILLVAAAIPVAIALNAVRIFLTGFLVYFVDARLAEGVMHYSEGWVMFVIAFAVLGGMAFLLQAGERLWKRA